MRQGTSIRNARRWEKTKTAEKTDRPRKLIRKEVVARIRCFLKDLVRSKAWVTEKVAEGGMKTFSCEYHKELVRIVTIQSEVCGVLVGEASLDKECCGGLTFSLIRWAQDRIRDQEEREKLAIRQSRDGRYPLRMCDAVIQLAERLAKRKR